MTDYKQLCAEYKQLCAELLSELENAIRVIYGKDGTRHISSADPVIAKADAALAEPEPEEPTRAYLRQVFEDQSGYINDEQVMWWSDFHAAARAVLARWSNHPGSPDSSGNLKAELTGSPAEDEMAELATAEMVRQLRTKAATEKVNRCHYSAKLLTRAADLLEHLSPAQPVPVSERLPGPEGPTDQEIQEWADACSEAPLEELDPEVHGWRRCFTAEEFSETIRAALARWGNHNTSRSI